MLDFDILNYLVSQNAVQVLPARRFFFVGLHK